MTAQVKNEKSNGVAESRPNARRHYVKNRRNKARKAKALAAEIRPEEDHVVEEKQDVDAQTPAAIVNRRSTRKSTRSNREKRVQKRNQLSRVPTSSSLETDATQANTRAKLDVDFDVVEKLATAVQDEAQELNPVRGDEIRRRINKLGHGAPNALVSKRKQSRRRRATSSQPKLKKAARIRIKESQFVPRSVTVVLGGKVTFQVDKNVSKVFSIDGIESDQPITLEAGQSYSHVFEKQGSFPFMCTIQTSMVGRINVKSGDVKGNDDKKQELSEPMSNQASPAKEHSKKIVSSSNASKSTEDTQAKSFKLESAQRQPSTKSKVQKSKRIKRKSTKPKKRGGNAKKEQIEDPENCSVNFDANSASRFLKSRWNNAVMVL